jgi:mono/diheme cytochrome c family protein
MRRPVLLTLLVALVLALAAAGCGGGEEATPTPNTVEGTLSQETTTQEQTSTVKGDAGTGKSVFASAGCGGCHTLKDAGTSGNVGPNLDDAKPDASLVTDRVTNGQGVMPSFKDQLSEKQIADVAAYVSSVAGA